MHHLAAGIYIPPITPSTLVNPLGQKYVMPGDATRFIQQFANGVGFYALVAAVVGVFIGAVMWAFGHFSQNYQQAYNGRRGVLVAGLAALLIGAASHLITFFFGQGGRIVQ
jgi:MFS family permease